MSSLKEDWPRYQRANIGLYGISVDRVPSLSEFKRQQELPFELLSDWRFTASRAYRVCNEERGISTRSLFLIDKDGVLRWKNDNFNVRDADQLEAVKKAVDSF